MSYLPQINAVDVIASTLSAIFFAILFSSIASDSTIITIGIGACFGYFVYLQTVAGWKQLTFASFVRNVFFSLIIAFIFSAIVFISIMGITVLMIPLD